MIEGTNVAASLIAKYRDRLQDPYSVAMSVTANATGICPIRVNARYFKARVSTAAGDAWEFALGIDDITASPMGAR